MSVDREVYRWQSYSKRNPNKLLAVKKSLRTKMYANSQRVKDRFEVKSNLFFGHVAKYN